MHKYQRIHDLSPLSLKLLNDQIEELWKVVIKKYDEALKTCPNGGNDGYITPRPCQCEVESIEADRDQWKARAEALESRYNELWDDATSGAFLQCPTCGNRNKGIIPTPCRNCIGVKGNWKWRHEERSGEE